MIKGTLSAFFSISLLLIVVAGGIWWNVATYNECRASEHSMMYCLRVIAK